MGKDYFVPFSEYGEDKFEEKHSKFTGRLWRVESAGAGGGTGQTDA